MPEVKDPELLEALRSMFASRGDLKTIVEYQQRLYASIQELTTSHKAIHDHITNLTKSHNQVRIDANELLKVRREINDTLRGLSESHRQTREEAKRAIEAIAYVQQEVNKIAQLEQRIEKLEGK